MVLSKPDPNACAQSCLRLPPEGTHLTTHPACVSCISLPSSSFISVHKINSLITGKNTHNFLLSFGSLPHLHFPSALHLATWKLLRICGVHFVFKNATTTLWSLPTVQILLLKGLL